MIEHVNYAMIIQVVWVVIVTIHLIAVALTQSKTKALWTLIIVIAVIVVAKMQGIDPLLLDKVEVSGERLDVGALVRVA